MLANFKNGGTGELFLDQVNFDEIRKKSQELREKVCRCLFHLALSFINLEHMYGTQIINTNTTVLAILKQAYTQAYNITKLGLSDLFCLSQSFSQNFWLRSVIGQRITNSVVSFVDLFTKGITTENMNFFVFEVSVSHPLQVQQRLASHIFHSHWNEVVYLWNFAMFESFARDYFVLWML